MRRKGNPLPALLVPDLSNTLSSRVLSIPVPEPQSFWKQNQTQDDEDIDYTSTQSKNQILG